MIVAREEVGGRPALAGTDFTFLPGDPPRSGHFAAFRLGTDQGQELTDEPMAALGRPVTIELALPAGTSVRRRRVPAVLLPVTTALALLLDVEGSPTMTATARTWASVMTAGLGLVARDGFVRRSARTAWTPGAPARWPRATTSWSNVWPKPCRPWPTPSPSKM
jgi:hypothetical protein